jgi:hypothetical protein
MRKNRNKNLLLHINGGLGKVIMATAVIRSYKLLFPKAKIIVVSGYPEVFVNNPDIYRFFTFNVPYLWKDYYSNSEWTVFAQDPYFEQEWIRNEKIHLIDLWCKMLKIPSVQKTPLLFFSSAEVDDFKKIITATKPTVFVQSTGGANPQYRSWTRNVPTDELDEFLKKYYADTHHIIHVCLPTTPVLSSVTERMENLSRRQAMGLMHYGNEVVGIDSYALHARVANPNRGKSTFFFPLEDSVQRLSYEGNNIFNIIPFEEVRNLIHNHHDYYSTVFKYSIEDESENCPIPIGMKWFDVFTPLN